MAKQTSALLSRDAILRADDTQYEVVDVPEWGGSVRIKGMTAYERDRFEDSIVEQKGGDVRVNHINMRAKLLTMCIVDEDGNRIFNPDDIKALGKKSARAINRCMEVAQRLNGISEEDVAELTENFDDDQGDDSSSG